MNVYFIKHNIWYINVELIMLITFLIEVSLKELKQYLCDSYKKMNNQILLHYPTYSLILNR